MILRYGGCSRSRRPIDGVWNSVWKLTWRIFQTIHKSFQLPVLPENRLRGDSLEFPFSNRPIDVVCSTSCHQQSRGSWGSQVTPNSCPLTKDTYSTPCASSFILGPQYDARKVFPTSLFILCNDGTIPDSFRTRWSIVSLWVQVS